MHILIAKFFYNFTIYYIIKIFIILYSTYLIFENYKKVKIDINNNNN